MKTSLNLQERRLSELHPADYNPRIMLKPGDLEYENIKNSIETFGYVDPIIINSDGTIIGGHQRYRILLDLGYDTTQVVVVEASKEQEKALNIALNKITGEWDEKKLTELLIELDLSNIDMQLTGFSEKELENLKLKFDTEDAQEDEDFHEEDAFEEATKETKTKRGDIWILGKHRLMCGNSTNAEDVKKLLQGKEMDLVITDPPYNVNYEETVEWRDESKGKKSREYSQIQNDEMTPEQFYEFLLTFYKQTMAVMREGAAIYIFHADSSSLAFRQAYTDVGLKLSQVLIWEKNHFVLGRQDYQWKHEPILYGWKEGAAHYFIDDRKQSTILCEDRPIKSDLHPTMKPIPLVGQLIKNSSKPGWTVYDPFGGSGTTIMAAEQLDRIAYSMELDEIYCDVIIKRWEEFTGCKAVKEEVHGARDS